MRGGEREERDGGRKRERGEKAELKGRWEEREIQ